MASEDRAAVWAAGFGAVGVKDDLPAPAVDAYIVVKVAEKGTVVDAGFAAVLLVRDVVHVGGRSRTVTAGWPGAVLIAEHYREAGAFA